MRVTLLIACTLTVFLALQIDHSVSGVDTIAENNRLNKGMSEWRSIDDQPLTKTTESIDVICFLGVECPVSRFYTDRLQAMHGEYAGRNVRFIAVFSNLQDSKTDVLRFSAEQKIPYAVIHDADQSIARQFGAVRVPEVFVLGRDGLPVYSGRIDDQYTPGVKRSGPTQEDLKQAIVAALEGKSPNQTKTDAMGCRITYGKPATNASVTYCKEVVRVFQKHCVECHRPGEIGTFDITDLNEVQGWADMIVETMEQHRMPPWHAASSDIPFRNARSVPDAEIALVKQWAASGAPIGDSKDMPEQESRSRAEWHLGVEPDLVVSMRDKPYKIPAQGVVDYQYFVVDPHLTEDRWISAAEVIPGNRSVVHHAIVFFRPPDGVDASGIGWLTAYVPGQRADVFPKGYARRIPAGSKLVFQMHYTTNGAEQNDTTKVGLNFIDAGEVTHEVFTLMGIDQEFEIPPRTADHVVTSSIDRMPAGGKLLSITPHMHVRGKSFRMTSSAGENTRTLLDVPHYDFNWQHTYELKEPLDLDSIERLDFDVTFDNSDKNPFNPDPNEFVVWGDQTWEEMAVVFLGVARPIDVNHPTAATQFVGRRKKVDTTINLDEEANQFADNFLKRFDHNADGVVMQNEVTRIVRDYSFRNLDTDGDQRVTREELIAAIRNGRGR
ncbi:MAG: redoxin domain-containing protein [Pirellulales bacterium]